MLTRKKGGVVCLISNEVERIRIKTESKFEVMRPIETQPSPAVPTATMFGSTLGVSRRLQLLVQQV